MATILHPTDFSPAGHVAFEHALALAIRSGSTLALLHVDAPSDARSGWQEFPHVRQTLVQWGLIERESDFSGFSAQTGLSVRKIDVEGRDPAQAIAGYLERHPARLVVMSTHGRTGIANLLEPSVASRTVSMTRQPVLVIRDGQDGFVTETGGIACRRILVAVDRDPDPQLALDWLPGFADMGGIASPSIRAIHAGERPIEPPLAPPTIAGCNFEQVLRPGDPDTVVPGEAERWGADLLVVTSAGPRGLREQVFGSTARRLVLASACPVMVLPAPGYDRQVHL